MGWVGVSKSEFKLKFGFQAMREGCNLSASRLLAHPRPCMTWADIWHTFWAAFNSLICDTWPTLCTLHRARSRSPPSCERAHAVRCRSCPLCALALHVTRLLSGFDLLFSDTRSERASDVCYRIAAISHGLPFHSSSSRVAFCGLTSATRQPIAIVMWVWGVDNLRASLSFSLYMWVWVSVWLRGDSMWRHVANWWCIASWSLI